jgi:restriction system protein
MLPLLKIAGDGNEHRLNEAIETLAQLFGLSENDRKEILPSGKQRKFDNRVGWARSYLQKAQLLSHTGRSKFCITERGVKVLTENPTHINIKFLKQFPEFLEFRASTDKEC